MERHHASIRVTGPCRAEVLLDGQPLAKVRRFALSAAVNELAVLTLELVVHTCDIDGQMVTLLPPGTAAALAALGWTPPPGQQTEVPDASA